MIRTNNDKSSLVRTNAQEFIGVPVALIVAFVIEEDLVQVFDLVLAGRGVETARDLFQFDSMALAVADEDCFDDAIGVRARGREGLDGSFVGAEAVSQLLLLA